MHASEPLPRHHTPNHAHATPLDVLDIADRSTYASTPAPPNPPAPPCQLPGQSSVAVSMLMWTIAADPAVFVNEIEGAQVDPHGDGRVRALMCAGGTTD